MALKLSVAVLEVKTDDLHKSNFLTVAVITGQVSLNDMAKKFSIFTQNMSTYYSGRPIDINVCA